MSKTSIGSYKGSATLSLDSESKYPFTFGARKAALIVEHYETIKAFAERYAAPEPAARASGPYGGDRFDMAVEDQMAAQVGR